MGRKSLISLITLIVFATMSMAANKRFTLVIDPGHGGHDAGALGAISKEKEINLTVALAFGRYVERNCPDVRVIYTRRNDVFIPLMERANIANRNYLRSYERSAGRKAGTRLRNIYLGYAPCKG